MCKISRVKFGGGCFFWSFSRKKILGGGGGGGPVAQFSWCEWGIPRDLQRGDQVSWPKYEMRPPEKEGQECQPSAAMIGEWWSKEGHDNPYKNERDSQSHGMKQQCGMAVGTIHYCDRNACFLPFLKCLYECSQLHGSGSSFRSQWYSSWQISFRL